MAVLESEAQASPAGRSGGVDFNKEFQRGTVIDYLIVRKPVQQVSHPITVADNLLDLVSSDGYAAYLYSTKDAKEYEDGFGPSLTVRVGDYETVWKRSRNKWNPYEKIGTIPGIDDSDYSVVWDRSRSNSYYVTERMYYYLDRDKHRERFGNIRGKLYITRLVQKSSVDGKFLLQFIAEELEDGQRELDRLSNEKKRKRGAPQVLPEAQHRAVPDVEAGPLRADGRRKVAGIDGYLPGIDRILLPGTPAQFASIPFDGHATPASAPRATSPVHFLPKYPQMVPNPAGASYPCADPIKAAPRSSLSKSSGAVSDSQPPSGLFNRGIGTLKSGSAEFDGPSGSKAPLNPSSSAGDITEVDLSRPSKRRAVDIASSALLGLSDAATSISRSSSPSPSATSSRPESPVNTQQTSIPHHMMHIQMFQGPAFGAAMPQIGMVMPMHAQGAAGPHVFPGVRMMTNPTMQFYPVVPSHLANQVLLPPQYYPQFFAQAPMLLNAATGQPPVLQQQLAGFQRPPHSASQ